MKLHDCPKDKSLYLIMIAIIPLILLALLLTPAAIVWSDDGDDCAGCEGECTQLKEQCIEGCNEIKSKAGALGLNYEERSAFGCHARACSWTFSRSWCLVPGYLECATLAYKNHIKCNTNCVYEYKAAKDAGNTEEMKTIMENCRPKCNEELQDDIFYKDLNCRLQACKVWCKQKGYPDAGYIRSEDKCKCLGERVDEPPKTDSEPQVTATQAEEEYSIFPPRVEVEVGKTVIFSVLTEDGDNIPEDKRSDFVWGTENHNPLNSIAFGGLDVDLNEIKIGKIFPTREFEYVPHVWGEFEATNLGQCQVCLYSGDKIIAKANVEVKRPEDIETTPQENIQNIQQLFLDEGFMGPIRNTSLSGWEETMTSLGAGEHFVSLLGLYLLGGWREGSWFDSYSYGMYGPINNITADWLRYSSKSEAAEWRRHDCGGYQEQVLIWLEKMRISRDYWALFQGVEFGPVFCLSGAHNAVVIFPEGTDWKEEGTVLDPWPWQRAHVFDIKEWEEIFPIIGGSLERWHRDVYPMVMDDTSDYANASADWKKEYEEGKGGKTYQIVRCPVNVLVKDSEGRRSGILDDGSMVFEIPGAFVVNLPDDEHGKNWYLELIEEVSDTYILEITGTNKGTFDLLWFSMSDPTVQYFENQPITEGSTAKLVFDQDNLSAPLILSDGTEVEPQVFEFDLDFKPESESGSGSNAVVVVVPIVVISAIAAVAFVFFRMRLKAVPVSPISAPSNAENSICNQCGNQVPRDAAFCKKCGSKM